MLMPGLLKSALTDMHLPRQQRPPALLYWSPLTSYVSESLFGAILFEVYLDNSQWLIDPTRLAPVEGIVRIGSGHDASDIGFLTFDKQSGLEADHRSSSSSKLR
jgi:hypothetical protein